MENAVIGGVSQVLLKLTKTKANPPLQIGSDYQKKDPYLASLVKWGGFLGRFPPTVTGGKEGGREGCSQVQ